MHFSPLRRDSLYGALRHWAMMDLPSIEDTAKNFAQRNRVARPKLWLATSPDIGSLSLRPWGVPLWLIGRQSLTAESGFRDSANWGFSRRCIIWHTGVSFPLFTPIHYSMSSLKVPFIIFVLHWPFWEHVSLLCMPYYSAPIISSPEESGAQSRYSQIGLHFLCTPPACGGHWFFCCAPAFLKTFLFVLYTL